MCCSVAFLLRWVGGGREYRTKQAGFWEGFLKKKGEQPTQENQPKTVRLKKDFLGF